MQLTPREKDKLLVAMAAEEAGIDRVLIPRQAAVFSAFGIAYSDIQHTYTTKLEGLTLEDAVARLRLQAVRGMKAEGFALADCRLDYCLVSEDGDGFRRAPLNGTDRGLTKNEGVLELTVVKPIPKISLAGGAFEASHEAVPSGRRQGFEALPLFAIDELGSGASAAGPCLIEEAFFTTRVPRGWRFIISPAGDILLQKN